MVLPRYHPVITLPDMVNGRTQHLLAPNLKLPLASASLNSCGADTAIFYSKNSGTANVKMALFPPFFCKIAKSPTPIPLQHRRIDHHPPPKT